jgi:hypothetical protein
MPQHQSYARKCTHRATSLHQSEMTVFLSSVNFFFCFSSFSYNPHFICGFIFDVRSTNNNSSLLFRMSKPNVVSSSYGFEREFDFGNAITSGVVVEEAAETYALCCFCVSLLSSLELDVQITCSFSQIILIHEDFFFGFFLELNKNPIEGFSAGLVNDDNIYEWQFCIIGAPDTL